jgi:hypothetical protein
VRWLVSALLVVSLGIMLTRWITDRTSGARPLAPAPTPATKHARRHALGRQVNQQLCNRRRHWQTSHRLAHANTVS